MTAPMAGLETIEMIIGLEAGVEDETETMTDGEVQVPDEEAETNEETTIGVLTTKTKETGMNVDPGILLALDHQ